MNLERCRMEQSRTAGRGMGPAQLMGYKSDLNIHHTPGPSSPLSPHVPPTPSLRSREGMLPCPVTCVLCYNKDAW